MQLLLVFILYQLSTIVALPFLLGYLFFRRAWKKKPDVFTKQRFGFVPKAPKNKKVIWIHAVSVGEMLSVEHLIIRIKKEIPESICYLTVGTSTAKNLAQKNIPADITSYLPYDFLPCMLLAYRRIKPHALIIVEAEAWPNLLMLAHYKKIELYNLNARVSKRSQKQIWLLRLFFTPLINCFDTIFTQSLEDKKKFEQLKIPQKKLAVLGNLKAYNVVQKQHVIQKDLNAKSWDFLVLLVGSLHPGELNHYLELFKTLKPDYPNLKLILALRHFTWKLELAQTLRAHDLNFFLWDDQHPLTFKTTLEQQLANVFAVHDILVVCVLGELFKLYAYADIFFLGGTFVPVGGHNLLEPAVWGVPTIIGPMYWNCKEHAQDLEAAGALIIVNDHNNLAAQTNNLLAHPEQMNSMKLAALSWLNTQASSVDKKLTSLTQLLKL